MSDNRGPIFIGGLSHSGKTPLRMVLGAHPEISMTRRTYLWDRFYGRFGDVSRRRNLERCLSAMVTDARVQRLQPDPERIRREFREGPATYARLFGLIHQHHAERLGKRRWGEQLGLVERYADPIFAAFPSARMIHMIRDPRARNAAGASRARGRRGKVGWETAMWLYSAQLAERNCRQYADKYRVVRYETFATRPVETIRDLCTFLGEEYVPSMAECLATIRFDAEAGADEELAHTAHDLPTEVAFIHTYARRELPCFDYAVSAARLSPCERASFLLVDWPLNRAAMAAWRIMRSRPRATRVGS